MAEQFANILPKHARIECSFRNSLGSTASSSRFTICVDVGSIHRYPFIYFFAVVIIEIGWMSRISHEALRRLTRFINLQSRICYASWLLAIYLKVGQMGLPIQVLSGAGSRLI